MHFDAVEHADGIVFLHAVEDGPANRSYGLQVAKLAGVPSDTVRQARAYLARLDKFNARAMRRSDDLFAPIGVAAETDAERARRVDPRAQPTCSRAGCAALDPRRDDAARRARAALYELQEARSSADLRGL